MHKAIFRALPIAAMALWHGQALAETFQAEGASLDVRFDGNHYPGVIQLPLEDEDNDINLGSGEEPKEFCLEQENKAICLTLMPGEPQYISVAYGDAVYPLKLNYRGPEAIFDADYRKRHAGKVRVEVPPAYELVNVAIALTPYAREKHGLAYPSPYLEAVRHRFADLADHAFVLKLDAAMREDQGDYHLLKMNGAAFELAGDDTLLDSSVYSSIGWGENILRPMRADMQDFAKAADFSRFLADFAPLYDQQIAFLEEEVDIDGMLGWLGREFPNVKPYDTVRIVFSPLVGYNQSLARFEYDGFRELQPHVNFPYLSEYDRRVPERVRPFLQSLILFTELNHGFINPESEQFGAQIAAQMPDRTQWASEIAANSYESSQAVFNEMVNWALFSVRAQDELAPDDAALMARIISDTMGNGRGFVRFKPFQDRFLSLRADQEEGETVAQLIPILIGSLPEIAAEADAAK